MMIPFHVVKELTVIGAELYMSSQGRNEPIDYACEFAPI